MDRLEIYAVALLMTIVVETLLGVALRPRYTRRLLVDIPLLNLITHPLLHLGMGYGLPLAAGEVLVMVAEAGLFALVTGFRWHWAVLFSVVLNLGSWFVGMLLL